MKLKLVVASMSVLGLVSCPVFAATTPTKTKETTHHTQHHHVMKHHHRVAHREFREYKETGPGPCQAVCTIPESTLVLEGMTQNTGRALPNPCAPGWFSRIALSGGINVDMGKWGNRNGNFMGENYQRLSLNDAYLNISARANEWAKAFLSISYNTATIRDPLDAAFDDFVDEELTHFFNHVGEFDAAYSNNVISGSQNRLELEQAFITFGNFDCSPIFAQLGKQFQDFGRYEIHPITESFTEVMSKTLATSVKVGFIASGFNGSVYVFDDPLLKMHTHENGTHGEHLSTNYGASLGFDMPADCNQMGWDVGVGWLYNLIGVNDIAYNVSQYNNFFEADPDAYHTRVGGIALYGDVVSGPFYVGARYVSALKRFNSMDLPKHGDADLTAGTSSASLVSGARGAKPWTAGIQAGFGFNAFLCLDQTVYVGYQASRQAAGLRLPRYRWLAGYGVDVCKNTRIGLEWDHDKAYNHGNGGTGHTYNLVTIRAAVKFS